MPGKKKSRYYPVQSRIELTAGGIVVAPNVCSMINRRHYPATGVYECNIMLNPTVVTGQLEVYVLKDNWDTIGAIRQAYKAYRDATSEERENTSMLPRWEDFRIAHNTGLTEMTPFVYNQGTGPFAMTLGEFELSNVVDAAGTVKSFSIQGPATLTTYDILAEWSESGNVDASKSNLSTTGLAYSGLEENLDGAQMAQLRTEGNLPPYDEDGNDGLSSPWTKVATLTNATTGADGRISTGFFRAPLGMIIVTGADANGWGILQIREGSHKGIKVHNILG